MGYHSRIVRDNDNSVTSRMMAAAQFVQLHQKLLYIYIRVDMAVGPACPERREERPLQIDQVSDPDRVMRFFWMKESSSAAEEADTSLLDRITRSGSLT